MSSMSSNAGSPVEHETFTYTDAEGVEITAYRWVPGAPSHDTDVIAGALDGAEPVGVVQISHGLGEYALRYDAFAQALTANGFIVYADDHRGHGQTGVQQHHGDLDRLGRLGPGGLRAAEAAILQLTGIIRERHPGLPLVLYGHSWGSLMAQRMLNREPRAFEAVVLSGTAYRTVKFMESGKLNARWAGQGANGFEWLSRDTAVSTAFLADPLCFEADVLKLFGLADGLRLYGTPGAGLAPDVPILIISGGDDPICRGDGLQRLAAAYRARGVRDVTLKVYPGARHETLNEINRDEVAADLITWITDRVAGD